MGFRTTASMILDEREELLLSVTLARKVVEEAEAKRKLFFPFLLRVLLRNWIYKLKLLNVNEQEKARNLTLKLN